MNLNRARRTLIYVAAVIPAAVIDIWVWPAVSGHPFQLSPWTVPAVVVLIAVGQMFRARAPDA
jgi:hypothetical protein